MMGTLYYGDARFPVRIDDRELAHLKIVILTKLRRNECFAFSWGRRASEGSGHSTVWIHSGLALHFEFLGSREVPINRTWLEEMMQASNRTLGLALMPEPRDRHGLSECAEESGDPLERQLVPAGLAEDVGAS